MSLSLSCSTTKRTWGFLCECVGAHQQLEVSLFKLLHKTKQGHNSGTLSVQRESEGRTIKGINITAQINYQAFYTQKTQQMHNVT